MANYSEKLVKLCNRKDPNRVSKECKGVPEIYVPEIGEVKTAGAQEFGVLFKTAVQSALSKGEKLKVYVDCDDVIASLLEPMITVFNLAFKTEIEPLDIIEWNRLGELFGERAVGLAFKGLVPLLPEKDGAFDALLLLFKNPLFDTHILTAVSGDSTVDRTLWVRENLPWFPIERLIFEKDKSKYSGGLLIDDAVHNIEAYDGLRVMINMPHNLSSETEDPRVIRHQSLAQFVSCIEDYLRG